MASMNSAMVGFETSSEVMPELSPILIEETILGVALGITLAVGVLMSVMLSYHWRRYGIPDAVFHRMNRLYFLVAGGLAILSLLLFLGIILR